MSAPAARRKKPAHKPVVLVVDDFDDGRELVMDVLLHYGFEAQGVSNGRAALDVAQARHPDVILMDLSLPLMDGREVTRRLKATPSTSAIPVIALTAHALDSYREEALAAGCQGFLTKPFTFEQLVEEVRRVLDEAAPSRPGRRRKSAQRVKPQK